MKTNSPPIFSTRTGRPSPVTCLLSTVACLLLTSCSLPQAQPDPTRFYVLSTPAIAAPVTPAANAPIIRLRPVELASYIKAKPMIVRRSENEVEFREFARWGEPLELGIARVLREELIARGAAGAVLAGGLRAADTGYNYELAVRILACEGAADGSVIFRAAWEISTTGDSPKIVAQGEYHPANLRWDGKTEGQLAAQLSVAVTGLAADIAAGVSWPSGNQPRADGRKGGIFAASGPLRLLVARTSGSLIPGFRSRLDPPAGAIRCRSSRGTWPRSRTGGWRRIARWSGRARLRSRRTALPLRISETG
jgi:uncharacterized lipoprotein YmbA